MADISMNFNDTPINIQLGEHGLYYGTSPHIKGLLVTGDSVEQVMGRVPGAIAEMRVAAKIAMLESELKKARERLIAILDWADLAIDKPDQFKNHGAKLLTGPVFDDARAFLKEKADG